MDPFTKDEILEALDASGREVAGYFSSIPERMFMTGDARRWGPAHHLGHLSASRRRLADALRLGAKLPEHPTGRSTRYADMLDRYRKGLAEAPREWLDNNPFTRVIEPGTTQSQLVDEFVAVHLSMRETLEAWSEEDFDRRVLKHPILGPMTTREMLLFILIHDRHHIDGVTKSLAA